MSSSGNRSGYTVVVEGETFIVTVRPEDPNTYDYDWVSGPNPGYGFSTSRHVAYFTIQDRANGATSSPIPRTTVDGHRDAIRDFLSHIDPETGYLED